MLIEALYRDQHRERFLAPIDATLEAVVRTAVELWDVAPVKHLKIIELKGESHEARPG